MHHPRAKRVRQCNCDERDRPKVVALTEMSFCAYAQKRARIVSAYLRAYERELHSFAAYLVETFGAGVEIKRIEHQHIRAYLGTLYEKGLSKASAARSLAAVRSWFKWLAKEWARGTKPCGAGGDAEAAEASAACADDRADESCRRWSDGRSAAWPERDRVIFELLYGCGIRNAELVGIDLERYSLGE